MKRLVLISSLIMAGNSFASTQQLNCIGSDSGIHIIADMKGYNLKNLIVTKHKKVFLSFQNMGFEKSHEMFKSLNFQPQVLGYPSYPLGEMDNCNYLLSLPGGDMRDYEFSGLLDTWGRGCETAEIELACTTK